MPAKSKAQFRLMKAAEYNPKFAKKVGIKPSVAAEFTEANISKRSYSKLPEKMKKGGDVSLAIGRGVHRIECWQEILRKTARSNEKRR